MKAGGASCRQDEVLRVFKEAGPMHVRDLAVRLGCSYMGAKGHCLALEKAGLVAGRNAHRGKGRPFLVYSLTPRGQAWFGSDGETTAVLLMRQARNLLGSAGAEKLLFLYFQDRAQKYRARIPAGSDLSERLEVFAKLRDEEGCMTELVAGSALIERHSPWLALHKTFPECDGLEETMVRQVIGVPVRRKFFESDGQYEIRFELHTPVAQRNG